MDLFDFLFGTKKKRKTGDQEDFDWETHCESCEEFLEDCECDFEDESRQDIGRGFDDDNENDD